MKVKSYIFYQVVLLLFALYACNSNQSGTTLAPTIESHENQEEETLPGDGHFDLQNFQRLVESYEDPTRGEWQNPDLIIETLGLTKDQTVADIGAGTGYFTFRIAEKGATVIAIDIDDRFLSYIEDRKEELSYVIDEERVITRLSIENDPLLRPKEVNTALLVNTYHFINDRISYLRKVWAGLKPDGKIVIVDYKKGPTPSGPASEMRIPGDVVVSELKNAGFKNIVSDLNSLEYQYIITARKP